jgi:hypothetical protein
MIFHMISRLRCSPEQKCVCVCVCVCERERETELFKNDNPKHKWMGHAGVLWGMRATD